VSPKARWTGSGSVVGIAAGIGSSVAVTPCTIGGAWAGDGGSPDRTARKSSHIEKSALPMY
jgi:hypothetical protein